MTNSGYAIVAYAVALTLLWSYAVRLMIIGRSLHSRLRKEGAQT